MARELNMDTQRQNFWKESIHKEATVRLSWHMKFSKEFARDHSVKKVKSPKPLALLVKPTANINLNQSVSINPNKSKQLTASQIKGLKAKPGASSFAEMRPVTPATKHLLYKGFSALGEGRYQYLQQRRQKKPEQKYEFPITSGWEYGWKITTSMKNSSTRPAEFGRTRIVKDSFYRTNGVLPIDDEIGV